MARLVLVHSGDPEALLRAAAAPFCVSGRPVHPLPLLAVRQGGVRDDVHERAAAAGCAGWLGEPLVVFAELPALLAGELAPLTPFERRALLQRAAARVGLRELAAARRQRGFLDAVDRLVGDLLSEGVAPATLRERLAALGPDTWEGARDEELVALYEAYLAELEAMPPLHGVARSDGRDTPRRAAEAVRARPDDVRRRLRTPFGDPDAARAIWLYGLNDLRRGWDLLLDALREAPFVSELRVFVMLEHLTGAAARAEREELEPVGEFELADALLARDPDRIEHVAHAERPAPLAHVQRSLLGASAPPVAHEEARAFVHALAAPDAARELEAVAGRVKALLLGTGDAPGVPPHRIAVVSRKARPYGERAAEVLRRHGVPVTTRLRANLAEIPAVAALLRAFRAGAEGFGWRTLAELIDTPYFDLELDATLLRTLGMRRRLRSLEAWSAALRELADEAALERQSDDYRGPDAARAAAAVHAFAGFRATADAFTARRTRGEWLALALGCVGRHEHDGRTGAGREGLWGLCRNACRAPHDERDALVVDATRRDIEGLECVAMVLADWRRALELSGAGAGGSAETLSPGAWYAELTDALDDCEVALSTPQRRGVQVVEASAAAWRTFDHLFLVGMSGGDFPADPAGRELFGDREREALYAAGLPLEPARVWFAREASLFRALATGARRSLHVSHAYAADGGAPQLPSAYFDDLVSHVVAPAGEKPDAWVETLPGSLVAPAAPDDVWSVDALARHAARRWCTTSDAERAEARASHGALLAMPGQRALAARVLRAAGVEHARRALRLEPPEFPDSPARPWNGLVSSPDLLEELERRFGNAVWSASQLEAYGRCPFTFFVRHVLGVRAFDEPEEDMDGATRGGLLHRCLEQLHERLAATFGDDALTQAAAKHAGRIIPQIVERTLDEFEALGKGGVPELRDYRVEELTETVARYLAWEIAENEKTSRRMGPPRRRPVRTELVFGMDGVPPVTLQLGGETLRLRGKIDRVDELTEEPVRGQRYIVDHKSGDGSLKPIGRLYDAGALLQLPLYLHALEAGADPQATSGQRVWGGAYQLAGRKCARTAHLHPTTLMAGGKLRTGTTSLEQESASRIHGALRHALRHVRRIRSGDFPAASCTDSCPAFCDARDLCREDRVARPVGR